MDAVISNLNITENESGLIHIATATITVGKTSKACRAEFIDLPMFDDKGELRMDAVGSMLMQAFDEPVFVNPPAEKGGDIAMPEQPVEPLEPIPIDPEYLAERKAKLAALKVHLAAAPKTKIIKDLAVATAIEAPIKK